MQFVNIAGYKFVPLQELAELKTTFYTFCQTQQIKGTILLSPEGINISLAATEPAIHAFFDLLKQYPELQAMSFRRSYSTELPFKRLKVKIKAEIITFKQPEIDATKTRAPSIAPTLLKQWLDEQKEIVLLDTRNEYEVEHGAFTQAQHLHIDDFSQFSEAVKHLNKEAVIVTYCTGGIRCEKAALYMEQQGFNRVYQLDGGILNYFAEIGSAHYQGGCFVFDERMVVDPSTQAANINL